MITCYCGYCGCAPEPVEVSITNYNTTTFPVGYLYEIGVSDPIPVGAVLCDGRALSRTLYHSLFEVIGTTYGSGDGTTFNVPELDSTDILLRYVIQAVDQTSAIVASMRTVVSTVVNSGTTSTVTMQVKDNTGTNLSGNFVLHYWFIDSTSALDKKSAVAPEVPSVNEATVATDATGQYVLEIEETGTESTWYIVVAMSDQLYVSPAIIAGV